MNKKPIVIAATAVIVVAGWALFRPELLFINKTVNESFPTSSAAASPASMTQSQPMALVSGSFHGVAHETKGTASIFKLANGERVLRFTNFETSNGPDVHVLLTTAMDASDDATVKNASPLDLGSIKGNIGDQNYTLPANVDIDKYKSVTVWCNRFNVNFGTAPLSMAMNDESTPPLTMHEPMPAQPTSLASGSFHGVAHETKGTATIYKLADGKRVLRFANFETSNGPDVRVLLIAANDASDDAAVKSAAPREISSLKGNIGDQNYDIPADVDLAKYKAVTIWCNRFNVNFGTAPLS